MKFKTAGAMLLIAVGASSCVNTGPRQGGNLPPPVASGPAVDGRWVDNNGIASIFQNGAFSTRSTDSDTLLASGTYVSLSPVLYEINMTSLVRNTQSRVNCSLVNPNQLNCTTDSNSQFSLRRQV
jgi:hypothetical protein